MHIAKPILFLLSGVTTGIAFVVSCGDNWHLSADAAVDATADAPKALDAAPVCDCPAAEPPIPGRLFFDSSIIIVDGYQDHSASRLCPTGAIAISGSCKLSTPIPNPRRDVILRESGLVYAPIPSGWRCTVHNNESEMVLYEIFVLCLKPAP
jgi:hypothetical protein